MIWLVFLENMQEAPMVILETLRKRNRLSLEILKKRKKFQPKLQCELLDLYRVQCSIWTCTSCFLFNSICCVLIFSSPFSFWFCYAAFASFGCTWLVAILVRVIHGLCSFWMLKCRLEACYVAARGFCVVTAWTSLCWFSAAFAAVLVACSEVFSWLVSLLQLVRVSACCVRLDVVLQLSCISYCIWLQLSFDVISSFYSFWPVQLFVSFGVCFALSSSHASFWCSCISILRCRFGLHFTITAILLSYLKPHLGLG